MLERVDVVNIGAGASGGAVAWSLDETKMRIVCLGQGGLDETHRLPQQWPRPGSAPTGSVRIGANATTFEAYLSYIGPSTADHGRAIAEFASILLVPRIWREP
jgi:choline dehydrogenase-like flavoprotein